jgi:ectoine hydroxylase-related dioxygenase (phytanoyl-CoA dioxygenase family)
LLAQAGGEAPRPIISINGEDAYRRQSARYLDFDNLSEAAAELLCHPKKIEFVEGYFGEQCAAMQTLLFENGTQQRAHQDYPYVHSPGPSALAGVWLALEEALADALFYYTRLSP